MTPSGGTHLRGVGVHRSGVIALILLFLVSLPAVTPRLYAGDEIEYFAYLRSMWFDHDLSFENEYRYFYDRGIAHAYGFHHTFLELTTPTGLRNNFAPVGSAILWAPLYGVADLGVRVAQEWGSTIPADGFSRPYLAAIAYGSALYGFLAILLSAAIAHRLTGYGALPAALVWFGTPLAFYMYLAPGMSHAGSAFVVAAFVAVWLAVRRRWSARGMIALGAMAALMTMVREQDAFCVVGPAVDFVWTFADEVRERRLDVRQRLAVVLAGVCAFAVGMLPQAWAYLVLNGRLGPSTVISSKMRWLSPHALQVLFSPEHGFFIWTPLAAICILGLVFRLKPEGTDETRHGDRLWLPASAGRSRAVLAVADRRRILICLALMFVAQVYVSGSVDTWSVAGSFGQRRFVGMTVVLVAGLAAWLAAATGLIRALLGLVVAVAIWWNVGLMIQFGAGMMDRQRLDLRLNAYNTFVVVPRSLPGLAYRYFFDRASFYHPAGD